MRRQILLSLVLSVALFGSGCVIGFAGIRGSGNVITLDQDLSDFDFVRAGYGCRVTLTQGSSYRVTIRIDDNLEEFLKVERQGSTLHLGLESGRSYRNINFEADIQMPDLRGLRLSGGSRGQLEHFRLNHDLEIDLSGGSRVEGSVDAERLELGTSGGAQAELRGVASHLRLSGSGGSRLDLGDLEAGSVEVDLSGGSRSTVNLAGRLTGSLSGGSSVFYVGNPEEIRVSKSGGARVVRQ